ncbi:hypothetical protein CUMW_264230, partial [Citrus unshiu]
IGSIILAAHDASDVFMEAAKVFKYFENELGATVIFGLFAISRRYVHLLHVQYNVADALCVPDILVDSHILNDLETAEKLREIAGLKSFCWVFVENESLSTGISLRIWE